MPIGFLPPADRDRLNHFPAQIPDDDLRAFFLLSDADQQVINHQREAHTRLGFALQLCALRYLGFAPDDLSTTHLQQVQAYLGFRLATPLDFYALQTWLVERALEHDKPTLLLQLACEKLYREKIVRPGVTRLERLVATARDQAHAETFRRLTPLLTDERKTFLDG